MTNVRSILLSFTRKEADYLTTKMLSMEKFDNGIRIFWYVWL